MYDQDNLDILMLKAVGMVDIDVIVCVYISNALCVIGCLFITWTAPPFPQRRLKHRPLLHRLPCKWNETWLYCFFFFGNSY